MNQIKNGTFISEEFPYSKPSLGTALQLSNNVPIDKLYDEKIDMFQQVGWFNTASYNGLVRMLFTKYTINIIKQKVSDYLQGIDRKGRRIIPSDRIVTDALYGVFQSYQPDQVGDIYSRYLVTDVNRDDYSAIVDMTISLLYRGIQTDLEMANANEKLTVWTTILGDFNEHGLRSHPILYMKEKRPDPFLFNMRY
jgi:hypothetical protein